MKNQGFFESLLGFRNVSYFLTTYLFVWMIRNWDLLYFFMSPDSGLNMSERILYIKSYFLANRFICGIFYNACWSILAFTFFSLILSIGQIINSFRKNILVPQIQKWTKGKFVTMEVYEDLKLDEMNIRSELDAARESLRKSEVSLIAALEKGNNIQVLHDEKKVKVEELEKFKNMNELTQMIYFVHSNGYTKNLHELSLGMTSGTENIYNTIQGQFPKLFTLVDGKRRLSDFGYSVLGVCLYPNKVIKY